MQRTQRRTGMEARTGRCSTKRDFPGLRSWSGVYAQHPGNDDINAIGGAARLGGPGQTTPRTGSPISTAGRWRALICFAGEGGWLVLMPRLAHRVSARRTREEADHALA